MYYDKETHSCNNDEIGVKLSSTDIDLWIGLTLPDGYKIKENTYPFEVIAITITTEQLQQKAKQTRDAYIESDIVLDGTDAVFQIDAKARANIGTAIRKAERQGYSDTDSRLWRLADNSWRETSFGEIKKLLEQYDDRLELVWQIFNEWDAGDKLTPFVIE